MDADDLISHIETLPVGDGDFLGEPYRVLKYQKTFLRGAFRPGIIRAGFTLARGGGKTGLASAIALSALLPDSPLHQDGFECAIVASSFQQGTIAGNSVKTSLRLMGKEFGRVGHSQVLEKIRSAVGETVLACCGVPVELAEPGQGTAAREAWRRRTLGKV